MFRSHSWGLSGTSSEQQGACLTLSSTVSLGSWEEDVVHFFCSWVVFFAGGYLGFVVERVMFRVIPCDDTDERMFDPMG